MLEVAEALAAVREAVGDLVAAVVRAEGFREAEHGHLSEVLRRSAGHPRLRQDHPRQPRGLRLRRRGRAPEPARDRMLVVETLVPEIVHRRSREIGRAAARVVVRLAIALRHCQALDRALALGQGKESVRARALRIVPELDQGLRTVPVPRSFRVIVCRDSVRPLAREHWVVRLQIGCRIKGLACRIAWPIGRARWRTADRTSATACRTAAKIGNKIEATAKTIARIGATTIAKTGRTGLMVITTITATGITAVGIPEPVGATCGTTTRSRRRSA